MSSNSEFFVKSLKTRLKRLIGIEKKNNGKSKKYKELKELLEKDDDTLYDYGFAIGTVSPFLQGWFRRALITYFSKLSRKEFFSRSIRAMIVEAVNIYNLGPVARNGLTQLTINGYAGKNDEEGSLQSYYTYAFAINFLAKEKKSGSNVPGVNIEKLIKFLKQAQAKEDEDTFEYIAKNKYAALTDKEIDKLDYVISASSNQFNAIKSVINMQVNETNALANWPMSINGRLSKYNKSGNKKITYEKQMAAVILDMLEIIEVKYETLVEVHEETA